jgi:hypothetical protein
MSNLAVMAMVVAVVTVVLVFVFVATYFLNKTVDQGDR